ncbi:DUF397 domain-containing protein [Streptomyces lunaelactis]|uniref:DUF397 domain-containing protein n=1 Tax=Streptomyces lunaelactis TaxID=1535768 RepID=A0A2R4T6F5_9ACTN|nr:DUF397 domain-containing protein [Streptomyces lunaelactis]AVZ74676.1 DUF397 domain-containing protein [Streptomyces lunaelactis]NUK86492.1 DUF397 domain-containing protein [Streptomyces lunaelactis]NUL04280.1 DUF397 domain-containing protein [Streptomyces lunaelactis]
MTLKRSAGNASALEWFKSSYSDSSDGNDCVEIAATPGTVHVRDSKNTQGPRLAFTEAQWADFVTYTSKP